MGNQRLFFFLALFFTVACHVGETDSESADHQTEAEGEVEEYLNASSSHFFSPLVPGDHPLYLHQNVGPIRGTHSLLRAEVKARGSHFIGSVHQSAPLSVNLTEQNLVLYFNSQEFQIPLIPHSTSRERLSITDQDLRGVFTTCPLAMDHSSPLSEQYREHLHNRGFVPPDQIFAQDPLVIGTSLRFRSDEIRFIVVCQSAQWNDLTAEITLEYQFTFDEDLFDRERYGQTSPLPPITPNQLDHIYDKGKGTKFLEYNFDQDGKRNRRVLRFDLATSDGIVMLDDTNISGQPVDDSSLYQWAIVKGLRAAKESLDERFPELGQRLVLKSQHPASNRLPDITVIQGDIHVRDVPVMGMASALVHEPSGLMKEGQIRINTEAYFKQRSEALYGSLIKAGLMLPEEFDKAQELLIMEIVMHELGHVLGLSHNFAGYSPDPHSGHLTIDSMMSYPHLLIPFTLLKDQKLSFGRHDILSLQYLYADLYFHPNSIKSAVASQIIQIPYETNASNEFEESFDHLGKALEFYRTSNHPMVQDFKDQNPCPSEECWSTILNDQLSKK